MREGDGGVSRGGRAGGAREGEGGVGPREVEDLLKVREMAAGVEVGTIIVGGGVREREEVEVDEVEAGES